MDGVTPETGWQIVCFIVAAGALWANWQQASNGRTAQRRIVEFTEEFATKDSLDELKASVKELGENVKEDVSALHNRITEVGREVSEAAGETRMMIQNLAQLSTEVRNRKADK